jgi:hypothetical protein
VVSISAFMAAKVSTMAKQKKEESIAIVLDYL